MKWKWSHDDAASWLRHQRYGMENLFELRYRSHNIRSSEHRYNGTRPTCCEKQSHEQKQYKVAQQLEGECHNWSKGSIDFLYWPASICQHSRWETQQALRWGALHSWWLWKPILAQELFFNLWLYREAVLQEFLFLTEDWVESRWSLTIRSWKTSKTSLSKHLSKCKS